MGSDCVYRCTVVGDLCLFLSLDVAKAIASVCLVIAFDPDYGLVTGSGSGSVDESDVVKATTIGYGCGDGSDVVKATTIGYGCGDGSDVVKVTTIGYGCGEVNRAGGLGCGSDGPFPNHSAGRPWRCCVKRLRWGTRLFMLGMVVCVLGI